VKETRSTLIESNDQMQLTGTPIIFDQEAVINDRLGKYKEVIKRGALDGADLTDIRLLYNHDMNKIPLARTPKTMAFNVDEKGLHMMATLPDTEEAKAVHTAVSRGDLSGMSFTFTVPKGGSSYDSKTNTRTISKIAKVYECSVVPFPAYQQTSVEARAEMTDAQGQEIARQQLKIKVNQIMRKGW